MTNKTNDGATTPEEQNEQLEMTPQTALELQRLHLAVLIDIRQKFEIELQGEIAGASFLPLFHFKRMLGQPLTELEQEALDEDIPDMRDIQHFLAMINSMHHSKDLILVCICNSGHRSLTAARLLRLLGYEHSYSLAGGFLELDEFLEAQQKKQESKVLR